MIVEKKIRDLTKKEKQRICENLDHQCYKCPLSLNWTVQCISFLTQKNINDFEKKLDIKLKIDDDF